MENSDLDDGELMRRQAQQLENLLPHLIRRLFTLEPDHPVTDMPLAQLRVSTILQGGSRTLSNVSEELGISVSATTQIADRMERAGLIDRVAGVDDRRTRYLKLSAHGEKIMNERRQLRVARAEAAMCRLTPEQREAVLEILAALLDSAIASAPEVLSGDPAGLRQQQG